MMAGAIGLYEEALRARTAALVLRTADGRALPLPVCRWCGPPDTADQELLRHCRGPVLDVGCGPGRLTVALAERGIPALGVDISRAAVLRVRQAGAAALNRSVFDPLPGQGRWATVLLADGNIGIGGLPARLLHRCTQMLAPGGRILVEAEPDNVDEQLTAWLEHPDGRRGPAFPWARLGVPALLHAAVNAGLQVVQQWRHSDRAFACVASWSPDSEADSQERAHDVRTLTGTHLPAPRKPVSSGGGHGTGMRAGMRVAKRMHGSAPDPGPAGDPASFDTAGTELADRVRTLAPRAQRVPR